MALDVQHTLDVFSKLQKKWRHFKAYPAGKRFRIVHAQQADAPSWVKALMFVATLLALAIGVVLTVVPGPAVVFFALAGALAAAESAWVARRLDRGEVAVRNLIAKLRRRRSKSARLAD